jgi:hypothetical protein
MPTKMAIETGNVMMKRDSIPNPKTARPRADLDDGARRFVAEHPRGRHGAILDFLDVGWADPTYVHAHQQFVGAYLRNRQSLQAQIVLAAINHGLHIARNK